MRTRVDASEVNVGIDGTESGAQGGQHDQHDQPRRYHVVVQLRTLAERSRARDRNRRCVRSRVSYDRVANAVFQRGVGRFEDETVAYGRRRIQSTIADAATVSPIDLLARVIAGWLRWPITAETRNNAAACIRCNFNLIVNVN